MIAAQATMKGIAGQTEKLDQELSHHMVASLF
jgi:hypothetical protein